MKDLPLSSMVKLDLVCSKHVLINRLFISPGTENNGAI